MGVLACALIILAPGKSIAQGQYISDQDFYDNLSPYGVWVYDPQYGDMWVPDVDGNFRPYATRGHWVLTEYGNTWVSDYPWGWATFHYGRWVFDDYYGWAWVPGYEWAPAWVSWRQTAGYYGWAPLTPNISIDISFGGGYTIPDNYWVFAPQNYINSPRIYNYYVPHTRVVNIIRNTTIINNIYSRDNRRYISGPRIQDIQRATKSRPQIYNISNANRPGSINVRNKTVNIYRPEVRHAPDARPARVVDGSAYKKENPNASIARRAAGGAPAYNRENASKLASVARSATPNNNVVRVNRGGNNDRPNNDRPNNRNDERIRSGRPEVRPSVSPQGVTQPATPGQPGSNSGNNRPDRRREPNATPSINNRQAQPNNIERNRDGNTQQQDMQRQQQDAQRQAQRSQREMQRQQQDAQRQLQQNTQQQDAQRQQQREAQRQQRELQRQQQDAQRQSQQNAQQQDMQRQQQDAQRQQQREAQRQQRELQRQQQDVQRQSQQNAQQQEVQRQQRDAQRQQQDVQQRQAQDAQRQAEQQQRQQQREQQRQQRPARQAMPGQ